MMTPPIDLSHGGGLSAGGVRDLPTGGGGLMGCGDPMGCAFPKGAAFLCPPAFFPERTRRASCWRPGEDVDRLAVVGLVVSRPRLVSSSASRLRRKRRSAPAPNDKQDPDATSWTCFWRASAPSRFVVLSQGGPILAAPILSLSRCPLLDSLLRWALLSWSVLGLVAPVTRPEASTRTPRSRTPKLTLCTRSSSAPAPCSSGPPKTGCACQASASPGSCSSGRSPRPTSAWACCGSTCVRLCGGQPSVSIEGRAGVAVWL